MRTGILAFSLGVLAGGFIPQLPPPASIFLLWLPLLLGYWYRLLLTGALFCLGIWWLLFQAITQQQRLLPAALEQQDLWVSGIVAGLPQGAVNSTRLTFIAESWCVRPDGERCATGQALPVRRLLLNDYGGHTFTPGQHWLLQVRLKRPHGFANPGGFDYEAWLFREGVDATGYIRQAIYTGTMASDPASRFNRFRQRLQAWLRTLPLAQPAFIAALTIGDRYAISDRQWQLLTLTGTNHLMVISGLHVGLVAWLAFHLGRWLFRTSPRCCLVLPANRLAAIAAILAAATYSGLAGFNLPVQRALIMVCCLMSGQLLARQTQALNSLCLALLFVLLRDPLAPHSAGFWLSFVAVAILLLTMADPAGPGETPGSGPRRLLRTQYVLFLGLAPVMLVLFRQLSLLAPLVNLVAIPLVGLLVVPCCLLAVAAWTIAPHLAALVIVLPDRVLAALEWGLDGLSSHLDFLLVRFPNQPPWLVGLLAAVLLWHLARPCRQTWGALAAAIVLGYNHTGSRPPHGTFDLDILDVGQGLAVVVTTRAHVLVYDTGPVYSPRFNAGSGIIQPFLEAGNAGRPDLLITSHGDGDHAGGLPALRAANPGSPVISGEPLPGSFPAPGLCHAGLAWQWDGVQFRVLHPTLPGKEGNTASCVLKVSAGHYSVLLPGDIEAVVELALVRRYRDALQADILVAPHHGSRSSSTTPFVRQVGARHVVFTAGYLNRFGHPEAGVVSRYRRLGATLHNTAMTGAIRFHVSRENGVGVPSTYRDSRPRFWSRGPQKGI